MSLGAGPRYHWCMPKKNHMFILHIISHLRFDPQPCVLHQWTQRFRSWNLEIPRPCHSEDPSHCDVYPWDRMGMFWRTNMHLWYVTSYTRSCIDTWYQWYTICTPYAECVCINSIYIYVYIYMHVLYVDHFFPFCFLFLILLVCKDHLSHGRLFQIPPEVHPQAVLTSVASTVTGVLRNGEVPWWGHGPECVR